MEEEKNLLEENNEGFTLLELLNILKNNLILLILIVIGFFIVGFFYTKYIVTPMYTSSIDILISIEEGPNTGTDSAKTHTARQVANNIREFIKFHDIIDVVVSENNLQISVNQVANNISTSLRGDATAVKISYQDASPEQASLIVTALAQELSRRINLPRVDDEGETNKESLKFATESVKLINQPKVPTIPTSPNLILNLIISILLGGIVGVVIVILKEQFSTKFSTKTEVERVLKLPVLALIPEKDDYK